MVKGGRYTTRKYAALAQDYLDLIKPPYERCQEERNILISRDGELRPRELYKQTLLK